MSQKHVNIRRCPTFLIVALAGEIDPLDLNLAAPSLPEGRPKRVTSCVLIGALAIPMQFLRLTAGFGLDISQLAVGY